MTRRPLTFSTVASARTLWPTAVGARWSMRTLAPTVVSLGASRPSSAAMAASSQRATSAGVARTGTEPDRMAMAVSASVTTNSTLALSPTFAGTGLP